MSGINIYALRSPYSIRAMNDCVTEVVFVVDSERHTRSRCMWALCTVHCRRCRCARVMFTHSPLHTMNRLGWLCTNKQQTKNCKQLNLNTRRENTLWENTVWNVETPPDKIHRKSSREKRKKTYSSNWMQKFIYW